MPNFWSFMRLVNQSQLCSQSYTVCFEAGHRLAGNGSMNFGGVRGLNAYGFVYSQMRLQKMHFCRQCYVLR